jgi:adenine-specific DNA-methyltransferase
MPTLQFKGKNIIWNHHLAVTFHTLDEVPELHYQPEKANGNMIIEGDNLIAIKALLPQFAGQIKCICIDPPYNTGNDNGIGKGWIYNDNVNSPLIKDWIGKEVGIDDLTRHDKWLCMLSPRIKLLKELLQIGGVIFVNINEVELHHLKSLMDEIFGEENFVEIFSWTKTYTPPGLSSKSRQTNEYILCYENQKTANKYRGELLDGGDQPLLNTGNKIRELTFPKEKVFLKLPDGKYDAGEFNRVALIESINVKNGKSDKDIKISAEFKWTEQTLEDEIKKGTTFIIKSEKFAIRFIRVDEGGYKAPTNLIKEKLLSPLINKTKDNVGSNETASSEIEELVSPNTFPYPKPVSLIKFLMNLCTVNNDIVLDSFAGSGTTMHAVMELNKEDGGNRKCIMVQMPENSEAEPDKNICKDITRERVKRAIDKYGFDSGFKYYRLGIPLDAETMLAGQLPTYKQFAKYVYYLCTGKNLEAEDKINEADFYVGEHGKQAIYLVYKQDYETLTRLALNLTLAEKIKTQQPGKKRIVYAPSCFLDEEYLTDNQIEYVGIPYNLFQRTQ